MSVSLTGRRVLVAGVFSAKVEAPEVDLALFAATISARGGIIVGQVLQRRGVSRSRQPGGARRLNSPMAPATYFGSGKAQEIAELRRALEAEVVVVRAKLRLAQLVYLERIIGCPVLDMHALG